MSVLWPRLPEPVALEEYEKVRAGSELHSASHHPEQVYAPVGERVESPEVARLSSEIAVVAESHGFPALVPDASKIAFDRDCAPKIRGLMDITWAEAGTRSMWSFVALVALPEVTYWRFGAANVERWVATDLTRHTWARLWWQAVVFESDPELLGLLTESDLNQLLERRAIGGDPRLVRSIARALVQSNLAGLSRRRVIRDVSQRLLRHLAFVDVRALDDRTLIEWCSYLVSESVVGLRQLPPDA